jgi:hypothetical protein
MIQVNLQLSEKTLNKVKEIAKNEELPYTSLIRSWVVQRIKGYAPVPAAQVETGTSSAQPIKESVPT